MFEHHISYFTRVKYKTIENQYGFDVIVSINVK